MIYELRIYDVIPNRREPLYQRFVDGALELLRKHGFRIVNMWEPTDGQEKLVYLLEWDSVEARERGWRAFRHDPEWAELKTRSEAAGPLVSKMESLVLEQVEFFDAAQ